jgi:D-alanyl-D-alanine carboxypeptidase
MSVRAARDRRLQSLVDSVAARKHIPHAVLAIEDMDRSYRWSGSAGTASPHALRTAVPGAASVPMTPMTPATPFFIASIDKTFTATLILQLHEQRALAIDDPVAKYLDDDRIAGTHRLGGVDRTASITIRNLLGHTSGLPDYLEDYPKVGPTKGSSLVERLFEGDDRDVTLDDALRIVRDELTPHFPPQPAAAARQRARYSDTNYQLLAAIVEAVTGQPLHATTAARILRPLDLRHTWYAGLSEPAAPTVAPAALWVGARALDRPRLLRSLNSIYSTADDLIAFMRGLVRGELFDDPATLALMQGRWNRFPLPRDRAALRAPGWPIEYALGLKRFRLPRPFTPFAPMPAVIGHTGSTGTWLFYCPDLDVFMAGAVNQATAGAVPYRLVPKVLRVLGR